MIIGMGIDVCPIERMKSIVERHGDIFIDRIFTEGEKSHAGKGMAMAERLAARFAAKEATIKAFRAPEGLRWKDMEVVNARSGAPSLRLHGNLARISDERGVRGCHLSLTHAGGIAIAVVVLEGGQCTCGTATSS